MRDLIASIAVGQHIGIVLHLIYVKLLEKVQLPYSTFLFIFQCSRCYNVVHAENSQVIKYTTKVIA